jgi:hypothetical protein
MCILHCREVPFAFVPLQVSPQFLLLQQEAHKNCYGSPGPCFLDCPIDPYTLLPLVAILDRTLACRTQF